jgi:Na+-transporting methylmalonyl-CoA/oxaloacetate decarboxylase gamma subunit
MIDWGFATSLAGIGFLTVLIVLSIVAVTIWLVGLLFVRVGSRKDSGKK